MKNLELKGQEELRLRSGPFVGILTSKEILYLTDHLALN